MNTIIKIITSFVVGAVTMIILEAIFTMLGPTILALICSLAILIKRGNRNDK